MELIDQQISKWVEDAQNIVIFTGAGVSAESGIPTRPLHNPTKIVIMITA